ncbi:MAG: tetratricopeptide repeat protein [Flavobacteriaceae bacterium]|nr:tetratricopeptide repeat protein [Flavobacteriaceae bacterium]
MMFKAKNTFFILFTLALFFSSQAQNYADKNYYLVDSLKLDNLVVNEKEMLQSSLTDFHKATTEKQKLAAVNTIIENSWDKNVWPKYNQWMHQYTKEKLGGMISITDGVNITTQKKTLLKYYSNSLNNIGFIYNEKGDLTQGLIYYYKSLTIREVINDSLGLSETYNNIGTIYASQENIVKALEFLKKSLKFTESIDSPNIATTISNVGILYGKQGDRDKAMFYFQKSLEENQKANDTVGIARSLGLIAGFYKSGNELDKSLEYLLKNLKVVVKSGYRDGIMLTLTDIADVYLKKDKTTKAMHYGQRALKMAKTEGDPERLSLVSEKMSLIYQERGNWEKAFEMEALHVKMRDSIQNNEIKNSLIEQAAKYELDKKQQEITLLSVKNEVQEFRINKNRKSIILISLALFSALILAFIAFRGYKKKLYINRLLERQKAEISRKNEAKKIMLQEIHHRVKNNLQVVNSLLRMQSSKSTDKEVIGAFKETQSRVMSMAKLHEKMYQSGDLQRLNAKNYLTMLVKEIVQNYTVGKEIELDLDIEELFIDSQTMMPLSLLINEIITNSLKYAFEGREEGLITVKFNKVSDTNELIISDDGIGFVPNPIVKGLGFRLIASFTRQLDGSIEKIMGSGTTYKLVFSNS